MHGVTLLVLLLGLPHPQELPILGIFRQEHNDACPQHTVLPHSNHFPLLLSPTCFIYSLSACFLSSVSHLTVSPPRGHGSL